MRMLQILFYCLVFFSASAQIQWPAITRENKPWARWWWEGSAVDKVNLSSNLKDYQAAGLGGLEITPIYGVQGYEKKFINYLSPLWMDMLEYTISEAGKLGLGIDLANGTGWPFGGPTTSEQDASKTVYHKSYKLNAGQTLEEPITFQQEAFVRVANRRATNINEIKKDIPSNTNLQELALDQVKFPEILKPSVVIAYLPNGEFIDVTSKIDNAGKLQWTSNQSCEILALFQGLHGKMVERAAPGGEGYAIDHFSAQAARNYFKKFDSAFRGRNIAIRAFFNDSYEVDDARGQSNWTPTLFNEFQKRRGYDLRKYLPALFGKSQKDTNERVRYDYRLTIGEMILDNFTNEWKKWGSGLGKLIRNQSHGSPGNLLDLYSAIDIPETEGDDLLRFKFATSATNVSGKQLASSEAATWLNEHFLSSWGDVKKKVDLFFLGGVNHIFYHGVNYSPKEEPWPGWLFYAAVHFHQSNPQWKHFHALNQYVARCQSFLQQGRPDNDILLYYPLDDRYSDVGNDLLQHFDGIGREFNGTDFHKIAESMVEKGYTYDFFSDRQLQNFSLKGKSIVSGGNNYQAILLPANKFISEKSFQKLVALANSGSTIMVYKNLPEDVPGLTRLAERRNALLNAIKGLKFTSTNGVQKATVGLGSFIIGEDIDKLLKAGKVRHESMTEKGVSFIRRKTSDGHIYFINNRTKNNINEWIPLAPGAAGVGLFNPGQQTGGVPKWRKKDKGIEVLVQMAPDESLIVQTYQSPKTGQVYRYLNPKSSQAIQGEWTIEFIDGGPVLPAKTTLPRLMPWTQLEGEGYGNFSGTAKYTVDFRKPAGSAAAWLLDLGVVNESADVVLNGKKIATLIGPTFQLVIPAGEIKENNRLEIIVANLMANRIAYMDRNKIEWKKFYNINMPARLSENSKNGLFDASHWKVYPSGLTGPVTIGAVEFLK